jgi:16S rRNA (cytidine1402-2'-O)-methyltransferase
VGYLPIDGKEKVDTIKALENESAKKNCTQIFIETPYRNNQLIDTLLKTAQASTLLCIAASITSTEEFIKTKLIGDWKKEKVELGKVPVIYLLYAGGS